MQDTAPSDTAADTLEKANQVAQSASMIDLPDWTPEPLLRGWQLIESQPLLAALVVVAIAFLAGKLIQILICRGITRLTQKTKTDFDDKVVELLHRPIFLTLFFVGLTVATQVLQLPPRLIFFVAAALKTILAVVWLITGFRILKLILQALSRNQKRFPILDERTIPLFDMFGKLLLVGGVTYSLLLIWGIDPTAWLASAGVLGLAVGFAAKDTLANLFGGLFIVADAPYTLGDFVNLDSGERGRVTHVGIRSTRILTRDDIEVTVPNAIMANTKIINESGGPWEKERIRIKVGVAYGSDLDQVCEVLRELAIHHDHICTEPAPRVRMRGFGDSSLDFELLCWIDEPVLRGRLIHELNIEVYKAFQHHHIEIPFPQRDVHLHTQPASTVVS